MVPFIYLRCVVVCVLLLFYLGGGGTLTRLNWLNWFGSWLGSRERSKKVLWLFFSFLFVCSSFSFGFLFSLPPPPLQTAISIVASHVHRVIDTPTFSMLSNTRPDLISSILLRVKERDSVRRWDAQRQTHEIDKLDVKNCISCFIFLSFHNTSLTR